MKIVLQQLQELSNRKPTLNIKNAWQSTKEHVIIKEESDLNFTIPYNLQQLGFVERDGDSSLNWRINTENGGGCGGGGVVWWMESGAVAGRRKRKSRFWWKRKGKRKWSRIGNSHITKGYKSNFLYFFSNRDLSWTNSY